MNRPRAHRTGFSFHLVVRKPSPRSNFMVRLSFIHEGSLSGDLSSRHVAVPGGKIGFSPRGEVHRTPPATLAPALPGSIRAHGFRRRPFLKPLPRGAPPPGNPNMAGALRIEAWPVSTIDGSSYRVDASTRPGISLRGDSLFFTSPEAFRLVADRLGPPYRSFR